MTTFLRLSSLVGAVTVAVTAHAVSLPRPRTLTACSTASDHVYALLQVSSSGEAYYADDTNDSEVAIGKPTTVPTFTVPVGSGHCGSVDGGSASDANYAGKTFYGGMGIFLSHNNSKDARIPQSLAYDGSAPNPGDKFGGVEQTSTNTCDDGNGNYFWKICFYNRK